MFENYKYVYIDFDDTIIVDGKVNTDVIKFLYQSKNFGKKIILLSRHNGKIEKTLENFSLSPKLFDSIIKIKGDKRKSDYIQKENAIFVDDSFAERKEVFDNLGIPVFALDAVQALFESKF